MPTRRLSGISLLASASSWVDIQFVEMGQHQQLEVRRYSPVRTATESDVPSGPAMLRIGPSDIRQARRESAEAPNMSDIMEASRNTTPRVVEGLLVETEPKLHLDSQALVGLDDAGIDHGVIDLLVAQSYPEQFVVERRDRGGAWSSRSDRGFNGFGGFYDPVWYSDLYPYYITPLGSRYWGGGYNPYLYGSAVASPFVIIADQSVEQPAARAINHKGYTRILPRAVETQRAVGRRGATSATGGGSTRAGSSGGSGGNTASPVVTRVGDREQVEGRYRDSSGRNCRLRLQALGCLFKGPRRSSRLRSQRVTPTRSPPNTKPVGTPAMDLRASPDPEPSSAITARTGLRTSWANPSP